MRERKLKIPVELRDIFTLDSNKRKVILIEGAPGSGKTTLFWHICQRWSAPEEILFPEFGLILLVKLRDPEVQKAKHLAEILPFADEKEEIASQIMQMKGKGVLLTRSSSSGQLLPSPQHCNHHSHIHMYGARPSSNLLSNH